MLDRLPRKVYWLMVGVLFVIMAWAMHGQA